MDITNDEKQRKDFCDILRSLAYSEDSLKDKSERSKMYQRLENLYYSPSKETQFRHYYSDIFSVLTQIQEDEKGDIEVLGQNLRLIREGYQSVNKDKNGDFIDISDSIRKLYDHVNLDIARLNYSEGADRKVSGVESKDKLQSQLNKIKDDIEKTQRVQKDAKEKLDKSQKDYITILGIFAAIVITFVGGIAFSTSVLENIHKSSSYRIIIISLIIGIVLINVLYGLFYYIDRLINSNSERKIKPLIITNIIMVIILAVTICMWSCGVVEKRNIKISKLKSATSVSITTKNNSTSSTSVKKLKM